MKWSGSVAIITGASRGIGRAVATAAARKGARVGLIARSEDELAELLKECDGNGAVAACDVGDRQALERAIASLGAELGPVGILINNAGVGAYARIADTSVETFETMMRINLLGSLYATKAVLPGMIERAQGHIVNIASINGRIGAPMEGGYSASKFALAGLSEAMRFELAPRGIGVSLINPGPVATGFFDARGVPYKRAFPRPVKPERIAAAVIRAVEANQAEVFIPRWLRFPPILKVVAPPLYRSGTGRSFREELR